MTDDIAIKAEGIYKDFKLPHEKTDSLKSAFTSIYKNKNKSFETQHALKDVSFEIKKGEFFGIVGRNGSGKSTLLKVIAGIYQPTKGSIKVDGKLVPFIELGVGFNPELTGRENVYLNGALLGFPRKKIDEMYDDIVEFAELHDFMEQKLKNYSSGMQVRLAFSVATRAEADILLVDEVLAVGDADFQRKCFNYFMQLKKGKTTVIFVTHDMNAVREYCDRAVLINENKMGKIGTPEDVAQSYSRLFIDKNDNSSADSADAKRWGNEVVKYKNIDISLKGDKVLIQTKVKCYEDIDKVIYGIHVFSADGKELTAMNNRMIGAKDLENVKKDETVDVSWELLNVFGDGEYYVTLTLVDGSGRVFDWYNEAKKFKVKRIERSTTNIIPPITTKVKRG